jgi:hypothetical protein
VFLSHTNILYEVPFLREGEVWFCPHISRCTKLTHTKKNSVALSPRANYTDWSSSHKPKENSPDKRAPNFDEIHEELRRCKCQDGQIWLPKDVCVVKSSCEGTIVSDVDTTTFTQGRCIDPPHRSIRKVVTLLSLSSLAKHSFLTLTILRRSCQFYLTWKLDHTASTCLDFAVRQLRHCYKAKVADSRLDEVNYFYQFT